MYEKLATNDPDFIPSPQQRMSRINLVVRIFVAFLALISITGLFFLIKNNPKTVENRIKDIKQTTKASKTPGSTQLSVNMKSYQRKFKKPDRVILDDKDFKITDCSKLFT